MSNQSVSSTPSPLLPIQRYVASAIVLHWLIVLVIVAGAILGLLLEDIPRDQRLPWANLHGVIGVAVLLLTFARLLVRATNSPPPLYDRAWVVSATALGHGALYLLTLALPLTGLVMWWLRGRGLDLWVFQIPSPLAADRTTAGLAEDAHKLLFWVTAIVVAGHVAAALMHQFVWKDRLLDRMRLR